MLARASRAAAITVMVLIGVAVYFAFVYNGRYGRIVTEFESETPRQRRVRSSLVLIYILFSFVFGIAGAMLHRNIVQR